MERKKKGEQKSFSRSVRGALFNASAVLVVATAWPAGAVDALHLAAAAEAAADD
jgi:hypothetical protein